jgi:hypothetical protein
MIAAAGASVRPRTQGNDILAGDIPAGPREIPLNWRRTR